MKLAGETVVFEIIVVGKFAEMMIVVVVAESEISVMILTVVEAECVTVAE